MTCCAVLRCAVLCCPALCCAVLCHAALCCAVLFYALLRCAAFVRLQLQYLAHDSLLTLDKKRDLGINPWSAEIKRAKD